MSAVPRFGAPVRVTSTGLSGTFAGIADRKHGRVRIGHTLKTYVLSDIVQLSTESDRWADLHRSAH